MPPMAGPQQAPPPPPPGGMPQQGQIQSLQDPRLKLLSGGGGGQQGPPPMPQMQGGPPGMPSGSPGMPPPGGGQQPGGQGGGGIFSRLGRAMGVPQPPSASQQQGTMAMLQEMKRRGRLSQQSAEAEQQLKIKVTSLLGQMEALAAAGKTESEEMAIAQAQFNALTKGMAGAGAGGASESHAASVLYPNLMKKGQEAKAEAEKQEQARESRKLAFEAVKAGKLSPEQVTQAVGYIDGTVELPPDMGGKSGEDIIGIVTGLQGAFPEAPEEALRTVVTLALDENPNVRAITSAMGQLGSSREKLQLQMQKEVAAFRARSDARAEEQIQMTREDRAKDKELDKVTGSVLALALGDVDKAYDEALLYTRLATGFDLEKSEAMLPRVQKVLKDLSKNPDALERMMAKLLEQQQQKAEQ